MTEQLDQFFGNSGEQNQAPEPQEKTAQQLAMDWLAFRESDVSSQLRNLGSGSTWRSEKKVSLTPPGIMPEEYRGSGANENDWLVAQLAYEQDEAEQDYGDDYADLNDYDFEAERRLEWELEAIEDSRKAVEDGDFMLIDQLAKKEKARQEKLAEERRAKEAGSRGKEFAGLGEMTEQLNEIVQMANEDPGFMNQRSESGWQLMRHYPAEKYNAGGLPMSNPEQLQFYLTPDAGKRGNRLMLRVRKGDLGYELDVEDFRTLTETEYMGAFAHQGETMSLGIDGGKAYGAGVGVVKQDYRYGYPDQHGMEQGREMQQEDFDSLRELVSGLSADAKASRQQE